MMVTPQNLNAVIARLADDGCYGVDTETTGLRAFKDDRLFSLIVTKAPGETFYFNFQIYVDQEALPRKLVFDSLQPFFANPHNLLFIQNAKFDLHMLAKEGVTIAGKVHCTQVFARILDNKMGGYSLGDLAPTVGMRKSAAVDDYIKEHGLSSKIQHPGKKKVTTLPHFDQVPVGVIHPYGELDGEIVWQVGQHQRSKIAQQYASLGARRLANIRRLADNERELTKVLARVERQGILVDRDYCERALGYHQGRARQWTAQFKELTGREFVDSRKLLSEVFGALGVTAGKTEKGNDSFTDEMLAGVDHPLAKCVREIRDAQKTAGTYFASFLYHCDARGVLHGTINQAGTDTARFSMSEPNLQNLTKDEDQAASFPVRRAFVPHRGYFFGMIDYDQQEYRLMLDLAGELGIIKQILEEGLDVHTATGLAMAVARQRAKTLNFLLIYGGGIKILAQKLGVSLARASELRELYFKTLPAVTAMIREIIRTAERDKKVFNWADRCYRFPDRNDCYKAPNTTIQGGGGDIMRFAMVELDRYLAGRRSRMLATVHDEVLFEIHESELAIVPDLRSIMESVYPYRYLPLTCSVSHSARSWGDKVKGVVA